MVRFWDLPNGRPTRAVQLQGTGGPGFSVTLSPDGKTLAALVAGKQIVFWEVDSGKEIKAIPTPDGDVYLRFSPDGKTLAMGTRDWRVSLLEWETGKVREFPLPSHPGPMKQGSAYSTVHFSPDAKWFVAGARAEEPLGVFEVATGREVHRLNAFALTSRVFPDNKRLAVLSSQNDKGEDLRLIRLFDPASGKELAPTPT